MDAMKQRWINELAKYDFSLEYQKGKNNTVADALSRISKEHLPDEEAERVLKEVPVIQGDDTVFKVFKEKEEDNNNNNNNNLFMFVLHNTSCAIVYIHKWFQK